MNKDAIIAALAFSGLKPVPTVDAQVVQSTGTSAAAVMSQKATTDALNQKQNVADPAGLADNLTPYSADSGATQAIPFINQGTGCGNGESIVDTGSYAQVKKKLGNTVCVNQLVDSDTTEVTIPSGRKYWARINGTDVGGTSDGTAVAVTGGIDKFCDLSLWYGSTANIPAHLLSHPEDFGKYYSGSLAYNPGQLVNANGSVLTSIGRNVWDEEWESGSISSVNGANLTAASEIRSKNYIPVIPNAPYWFKAPANLKLRYYDAAKNYIGYVDKDGISGALNTTRTMPSNCAFIRFATESTTYSNNITISLYYSGESGYNQYYPYSVLAEVDTGSEVLRSAGSVADEKTPDGTITRRVGYVDLGTLTWTHRSDIREGLFAASITYRRISADFECECSKYVYGGTVSSIGSANTNKTLYAHDSNQYGYVYIYDTAYTDAAAFKTAMSGIYLYYELATPTTEQGTPFSGASADNFAIDDFGSMYWTQTNGVPQGVEIFYPYDYKAAVDTILNEVNGDVTQLVTAEKVPDAPSSNGTYVLKVTVSGGTPTYSWVVDE